MPDVCKACPEKKKDYVGCRCQAFLLTDNPTHEAPVCDKSSQHRLIEQIKNNSQQEQSIDQLLFRNIKNSKNIFSIIKFIY